MVEAALQQLHPSQGALWEGQRHQPGGVRHWSSQANQSMLGNSNDTTINLNSTEEEMEVLDLDQTLTGDNNVAMEGGGGGRRLHHHPGKGQGGEGQEGQEGLIQKLADTH